MGADEDEMLAAGMRDIGIDGVHVNLVADEAAEVLDAVVLGVRRDESKSSVGAGPVWPSSELARLSGGGVFTLGDRTSTTVTFDVRFG